MKVLKILLAGLSLLTLGACVEFDELYHFSSSSEYTQAIKTMLNGNYVGSEEALKGIKDYLSYYTLEKLRSIDIYGGPYKAKDQSGNWHIALMYRDGHFYGYKHDKCYLLHKPLTQINNIKYQVNIEKISCSSGDKIKDLAKIPEFTSYKPISDHGKEILTDISNYTWTNEKNFPLTLGYAFSSETRVVEVHWTQRFNFQFIENYKKMSLTGYSSDGMNSSKAGTNAAHVLRLLEKNTTEGKKEFLIWLNRPWFMDQDANKIGFYYIHKKILSANNINDIYKLDEDGVCRTFVPKFVDGIDESQQFSSFQYMIIQYDPENDEKLSIQLHLLNDKISTENLEYYKN